MASSHKSESSRFGGVSGYLSHGLPPLRVVPVLAAPASAVIWAIRRVSSYPATGFLQPIARSSVRMRTTAPTELLFMPLPEPKHDQDRIAGTPASFHCC